MEADLANQFAFDPSGLARNLWNFGKGALFHDKFFQLLADAAKGFVIESAAHVARILQFSVLIDAEDERAEGIALAGGEPADDEVLLRDHFDLDPSRAA